MSDHIKIPGYDDDHIVETDGEIFGVAQQRIPIPDDTISHFFEHMMVDDMPSLDKIPGPCPDCGEDLIILEWNEVCEVAVCNTSGCQRYRWPHAVPIGTKKMLAEAEEHKDSKSILERARSLNKNCPDVMRIDDLRTRLLRNMGR